MMEGGSPLFFGCLDGKRAVIMKYIQACVEVFQRQRVFRSLLEHTTGTEERQANFF